MSSLRDARIRPAKVLLPPTSVPDGPRRRILEVALQFFASPRFPPSLSRHRRLRPAEGLDTDDEVELSEPAACREGARGPRGRRARGSGACWGILASATRARGRLRRECTCGIGLARPALPARVPKLSKRGSWV